VMTECIFFGLFNSVCMDPCVGSEAFEGDYIGAVTID